VIRAERGAGAVRGSERVCAVNPEQEAISMDSKATVETVGAVSPMTRGGAAQEDGLFMQAHTQMEETQKGQAGQSLLTPTLPPADLVQRVVDLFGDTDFFSELCDLFFFSSFGGQDRSSFREYSKHKGFRNTSSECRRFGTDLLELLADRLGIDENDAAMQYHLRELREGNDHPAIPFLALHPAVEKSRRALLATGLKGDALAQAVGEQIVTTFGHEMVERALGEVAWITKYVEKRTAEEQLAQEVEGFEDEEEEEEYKESQTALIISDIHLTLHELAVHNEGDKTDEERLAALEGIVKDATAMIAAVRRGEVVIGVEEIERPAMGGAQ
jgi:hypothetical protein